MKFQKNPLKFKIIKRPANINKPLFKKGDEIKYVHYEYGEIEGIIRDVFITDVSENIIYYTADFPDKKLTVLEIPEYELNG